MQQQKQGRATPKIHKSLDELMEQLEQKESSITGTLVIGIPFLPYDPKIPIIDVQAMKECLSGIGAEPA